MNPYMFSYVFFKLERRASTFLRASAAAELARAAALIFFCCSLIQKFLFHSQELKQ